MNAMTQDMKAAGVKNCEMESGTILTLAGLFGLKAGCICTVSNRTPWPGPSAESLDLDRNMAGCIEIAVRAMLALARGSRTAGIRSQRRSGGNRGLNEEWSGRRDSNPRLSAWEADILPLNYARSGGKRTSVYAGQTAVSRCVPRAAARSGRGWPRGFGAGTSMWTWLRPASLLSYIEGVGSGYELVHGVLRPGQRAADGDGDPHLVGARVNHRALHRACGRARPPC